MASAADGRAEGLMLRPNSPRQGDGRLLAVLGLLTAIEVTAIDIFMPALPHMQRDLHVTPSQATFTVSIFLVGLAIGQAAYGPLSDRYGRRRPLLVGLVVYTAGSALPLIFPTFAWLLFARFLQSVGAAAGLVVPRAIVMDCFDESRAGRAYSILMQLLGLAAILAPLLGGYLVTIWDWRSIFRVLTGLGVVALALASRVLTETLPASRRVSGSMRGQLTLSMSVVRDWPFLCYCMALATTLAAMFTLLTGSSFIFIQQYGWSPRGYSFLYASGAAGFVALAFLNTLALRSASALWLLWRAEWAQCLIAFALVMLACVHSPPALVAATLMTLLLSNLGFLMGNLGAVAMNRARDAAGVAASFLGVAQYAVAASAAPVAAAIGGSPLRSSACTIAAFCSISLVCCMVSARSPALSVDPQQSR